MNRPEWPKYKEKVAACFKQKTRAEWCEIMEHTDVCFAPVLSLWEAPEHPANVAREVFVEVGGIVQANAAPRFSRTKSAVQGPPAHAGQHTDDVLSDFGFAADEIAKLHDTGAVK
jgi:alpha-methylacyl-CoA racemase